MNRHMTLIALACASAACASPALADPSASLRTTIPLVQTFDGSPANGPSRNPAVSGDGRVARVMGYESDASNIVPGDTNGTGDIFVVERAPGWGPNGTPWQPLRTELASRGLHGAPANGRSWGPELAGDAQHPPRCMAFISAASNLVKGDTNHVADAFVYYLRSHKTIRVSVGPRGQQANGPSNDISVSGDCDRVAFSSKATNLGLTKRDLKALPPRLQVSWRAAVSASPSRQISQIYVHMNRAFTFNKDFSGLTLLASRPAGAQPSFDVDFAASGNTVVFT